MTSVIMQLRDEANAEIASLREQLAAAQLRGLLHDAALKNAVLEAKLELQGSIGALQAERQGLWARVKDLEAEWDQWNPPDEHPAVSRDASEALRRKKSTPQRLRRLERPQRLKLQASPCPLGRPLRLRPQSVLRHLGWPLCLTP